MEQMVILFMKEAKKNSEGITERKSREPNTKFKPINLILIDRLIYIG
jgi:hypothetical protein